MIPDAIKDFITQQIHNQLTANDDDLAEEMAANEKGRASITFRVKLETVGDKVLGKIVTTIPHQATTTDALIPDLRQPALPGM